MEFMIGIYFQENCIPSQIKIAKRYIEHRLTLVCMFDMRGRLSGLNPFLKDQLISSYIHKYSEIIIMKI